MNSHPPTSGNGRIKLDFGKKPFTFGAFIAGAYRAWGERNAKGIIHLAVKAHLIEFCGKQRYMIF